jgi:hypothetical protein
MAETKVADEQEVLLHPFAMVQIMRVGTDEPFLMVLRDLQFMEVPVERAKLTVKYHVEGDRPVHPPTTVDVRADATVEEVLAKIAGKTRRELAEIWVNGRPITTGPFRPYCKGDPTFLVKPRHKVVEIDLGQFVYEQGQKVLRTFEYKIQNGTPEVEEGRVVIARTECKEGVTKVEAEIRTGRPHGEEPLAFVIREGPAVRVRWTGKVKVMAVRTEAGAVSMRRRECHSRGR